MEDWKRIHWTDGTKINRLGSDGRKWVRKEMGELLSDRLVESTVKFGGGNVMMWGCMFWEDIGYTTRIEGKMDAELYCSILDNELQQSLDHYNKSPSNITSSKTTTPSKGANGLKSGLQTMGTLLQSGLHSLLTSTLLNIFGGTSTRSLMSMKSHL
jgi:hypothetical protein